MDLGTRITSWRISRGLSHRGLAEAIRGATGKRITAGAIYQWEGTGGSKTLPTQANLDALVRTLGISMERFYGRPPKARPPSG